jgi:hypothetical protein
MRLFGYVRFFPDAMPALASSFSKSFFSLDAAVCGLRDILGHPLRKAQQKSPPGHTAGLSKNHCQEDSEGFFCLENTA